jgi:restriction system protein
MRFKDAAYQILQQNDQPLHYNEITDRALAAGLLDTTGKTPHASMGALLYTDTLNPDSRFRRGDQKGTFALKVALPPGIQQQIKGIRVQVRQDLQKRLLKMHPQKFEELIRSLLEEMGFQETATTPYCNDKGVDVRGILHVDQLSTVKIAIQAKRWTANVGSNTVRNLRGSLRVADAEQGVVITPSDFMPDARTEAQAAGKTPISLINGEQLVDLLIRYRVGVKEEQYTVPVLDEEYWSEVLGVTLKEVSQPVTRPVPRAKPAISINFPLQVQATYKEHIYTAEMIDAEGRSVMMARSTIPLQAQPRPLASPGRKSTVGISGKSRIPPQANG